MLKKFRIGFSLTLFILINLLKNIIFLTLNNWQNADLTTFQSVDCTTMMLSLNDALQTLAIITKISLKIGSQTQ